MVPGSVVVLIQVVAAHAGTVTLVVRVVITASQERTEEGVKPSPGGHAFWPVEAQVPLADHVCGIASLLELLREGGIVQREAVGLRGSYDGVLEPGVYLIPGQKRKELVSAGERFSAYNHVLKFNSVSRESNYPK